MSSPQATGVLPDWLPGETAYSWLSRYHALCGNRLPASTSRVLFGCSRRGCQHDFPAPLRELCARTNLALGSAEEWALQRTILPYFLHLRPPQEARDALNMMITGSSGMLKFRLGLITSRFRAHHPLKACQLCIAEQYEQHGVAYWLLEHQHPGVWACLKHRTALQQSKLKSTGINRFGYLLPREADLDDQESDTPHTPLLRLAELSKAFAQIPWDTHLSMDILARTYRSAIRERGIAGSRIRHALRGLSKDFCASLAPLRAIPELGGLPATPTDAFNQLDRWVLRPRGGTHPLRHLSIIFWLFPNWEAFWRRYTELELDQFQPRLDIPAHFKVDDLRRSALLSDLERGCSARRAAQNHGVDTKTAMAWAASAGLRAKKRPKLLKAEALQKLVSTLQFGADKKAAAKQFSVSVETVTSVLRTEPGLQIQWRSARMEAARSTSRNAYMQCAQAHPRNGVKAIRMLVPAAYAWLYRNDRGWLASINEELGRRPRTSAPRQRVDWAQRDSDLHKAVSLASLGIGQRAGRSKLELIHQAVPELRAKHHAMQRLPRTRDLLDELTQQHSA